MNYHGSCHCGRVRIEVEGTIESVKYCNCSLCARKGALMWFVPRDALHLQTPEADLSTYTFNKHVIKHRFCEVCGIHVFGEGVTPSGAAIAAINIRALEGVDPDTIPAEFFDGRSV